MKKFTLLVAALAISLVTFAQGTITYNLNGGVTNDFGWKNKGDMFADFMADNGATDFETLEYYKAQTDPLGSPNICAKLTTCAAMVSNAEKWGWLKTYIQAVTAAQAADSPSALDETCATAAWRYAAGAFFVDGQRASWPKSADFSIAGQLASFQPTWKAGFCGPAEYAEGETVVLPIPFKEGESFLGWFKEADFSGEKVTEISGTGDVVLYAKFGEYIPTIAEVIAMADATATKVQGTVSLVAGNNFWIQDASAAILCFGENHGLVEGELATLAGEKVVSNGSPMLNNATVATKEAGNAVTAQTLLLSAILADSVNGFASYLNEVVYLEGLVISKYEENNAYITDGFNEIALYAWDGVTADKYSVGTKVSVKAVLAMNETLQLRGKEAWLAAAAAAGKDTYAYPEVEAGDFKFNFTNNWLYSAKLGNWADNRPNPLAEGSRSVVEKDGILYFSYRDNNTPVEQPKLVRVDAKTGKMLDPVIYANYIFKDVNGAWLFGPYTDLKLDNEGNAITSNLPTSGGPFQIWNVNLETGEGKLLIDLATDSAKWLSAQFPENTTIRLDRIGVYGDINGDATIMSVVSSGADVYYWNIEDGEWDGETNWIKLGLGEGVNVGGAPVICPIEGDYFYVDGFTTYPMLFDPDGNLVDAFDEAHEADHLLIGANGVSRSQGHNGVTEFEVNGEYYLIIAGDNTVGSGTAPSTFVLYKFADDYRDFKDMTQLYEFPMAGMGGVSNPQRVATSFAKPNEEGTAVEIYAFTSENGYGAYTLTIEEVEGPEPDAVENVTIDSNVWVENNTITASAQIEAIFTVTGQNVTALNGNLNAGAYIVRTAEGVAKVMVK
ncbi:MAG: InlB B-repeat-containing protein [Paludibacteraceae bacterium]|nr:InlB B-repeat-containing protein [Paludibacteraceae bacterium]